MQSFVLVVIFLLKCCINTNATTHPVFISTSKSKGVKPVISATEAAVALNSIHFMERLIGVKNSAEVKTYTQSANVLATDYVHSRNGDATATPGRTMFSWTKNIMPNILKQRFLSSMQDDDVKITNNNSVHCSRSKSKWRISSNPCPTHETVAEYIGQLWFLNKSGIRFRETMKVVAISPDGKSSTVECNTEYHNGSKWISCSKIICEFTSHSNDRDAEVRQNSDDLGVKMKLDCELLVWLPLPNAAKNGVKNKISSVFESVALDFFNTNTR